MKNILIILLLITIFSSSAFADYSFKRSLSLTVSGSEKGDGYYMSDVNLRSQIPREGGSSNALEAKEYDHGSGNLNHSSTLSTNSSQHLWAGYASATEMDYDDEFSYIILNADNKMTYSPMRISLGTGYYASRPLAYASLIKEKSWIKNLATGTSMQNEVEYAHNLDKDLKMQTNEELLTYTDATEYENTFMNLSEAVGDGKTHLGLYQSDILGNSKVPLDSINEDFIGNFTIEKNLDVASLTKISSSLDEWLPCCSGGYADMAYDDQSPLCASCFFPSDKLPTNSSILGG
jgi:hypothetical protein